MKKKFIIWVIFIGLIASMFYLFGFLMNKTFELSSITTLSNDEWDKLASNSTFLYKGKYEYQLRCYKCHGVEGKGHWKGGPLVGHNWKYGDSYQDIYENTYYGVGTMKGYGKKLTIEDIQAITVYVKSLSK